MRLCVLGPLVDAPLGRYVGWKCLCVWVQTVSTLIQVYAGHEAVFEYLCTWVRRLRAFGAAHVSHFYFEL